MFDTFIFPQYINNLSIESVQIPLLPAVMVTILLLDLLYYADLTGRFNGNSDFLKRRFRVFEKGNVSLAFVIAALDAFESQAWIWIAIPGR